jgi:hypothetical protein
MVTRGGGSRLCHGNDVPVYRDRTGSMGGGVQEFLRGVVVLLERSARSRSCWTSWTYGRRRWSRIGSLCQFLREPQGFPAHGLSLHCSRACAAETRSTHPRSLLQDRVAWSHLLRAVPVLLPHHWPPACLRVVCCLARTHACGNRAGPATGRTLPLAPADVLVQIRPDLRVLQLHCPFHLL